METRAHLEHINLEKSDFHKNFLSFSLATPFVSLFQCLAYSVFWSGF